MYTPLSIDGFSAGIITLTLMLWGRYFEEADVLEDSIAGVCVFVSENRFALMNRIISYPICALCYASVRADVTFHIPN